MSNSRSRSCTTISCHAFQYTVVYTCTSSKLLVINVSRSGYQLPLPPPWRSSRRRREQDWNTPSARERYIHLQIAYSQSCWTAVAGTLYIGIYLRRGLSPVYMGSLGTLAVLSVEYVNCIIIMCYSCSYSFLTLILFSIHLVS